MFGEDNFKVILVNSHSDDRTVQALKTFTKFPWISLYDSKVKGSLKDALGTGWDNRDKKFKPDVVHITETDGVPNLKTFKHLLHVYFEEKDNQIGSVSPMYTWQGRKCYPTHNHWSTDQIYKKHPTYGIIRKVGGCGVPLLYSFWKPFLIQSINNPKFPHFLSLDSNFGRYVFELGLKHLRVTGVSIEHYGGGKKSHPPKQRSIHPRRKGHIIRKK